MKKLESIWAFYKRFPAVILFSALAVFVVAANIKAADHRVHEARVTFLADGELFPELTAAFSKAEKEIACALYMFKTDGGENAPTSILLSALRDAGSRGVQVLLVLDIAKSDDLSTEFNSATAKALKSSGAEVLFDDPERRMHAKMCIIDRKLSFIGSHNYTYSALRRNAEVTLKVESAEVAEEGLEYIKALPPAQTDKEAANIKIGEEGE
jgi:phosphatidylserine/phosphatidylglycerophosphate/cardiolipin synthase-like enzyme